MDIGLELHNLTILTTACLVATLSVLAYTVYGTITIARIQHQILREIAALRRER